MTTVMVAVPPPAIWPFTQVTVPPLGEQVNCVDTGAVAEMKRDPAGSASVTVTPLTVSVPVLLTTTA